MKIKQFVTFETEVDVHVGVDDIAAAIVDEYDSDSGILRTFSNFLTFSAALTDENIGKISGISRSVILENLDKLAKRLSA